jgi:hypothetical protein
MGLSTFLNGGAAIQLRGLQWLALSEAGSVAAGSVVDDQGGGAGSAVWTFGTAVPCRIDPIGDASSDSLIAGRIDERSTHRITVPAGTQVATASRFAITGRGTYEVTAVPERTAERTRVFEVVEAS